MAKLVETLAEILVQTKILKLVGDTGRNTGEDKGGQTGGDTGNTDSDNKQTVVNDEVKTSNGSKDKSELPETD